MDAFLQDLHEKIQALKAAVEDLAVAGEPIPAVVRNTERIRASCRMLELEVSDLFDLDIIGTSRSATTNSGPQ